MPEPKRILITGASSGIGAALAQIYAAPDVTLYLSGQSAERMAKVQDALKPSGAEVHFETISTGDRQAMADWIQAIAEQGPLDLVFANAGIAGDPSTAPAEDIEAYRAQLDQVFDINVSGVFNTVLPAVEVMKVRGQGQIAILASLAAFRGLEGASAYCASKAAVRSWCEALRPELAQSGIKLNCICPGFVRSRITDRNKFPMPFFWETDKAARRIRSDLAKNKGRIAFPFPMYFGTVLFNALPNGVAEFLAGLGSKRFNKRL